MQIIMGASRANAVAYVQELDNKFGPLQAIGSSTAIFEIVWNSIVQFEPFDFHFITGSERF
jgi:hypothetical protein